MVFFWCGVGEVECGAHYQNQSRLLLPDQISLSNMRSEKVSTDRPDLSRSLKIYKKVKEDVITGRVLENVFVSLPPDLG